MMIRIRAKRDGFRRAGVAHSAAPVVYAGGVFTNEQLAILQAEPMLMVEIVEESAIEGDGAGESLPPIDEPETTEASENAEDIAGEDTDVSMDAKEADSITGVLAEPKPARRSRKKT